ncbi:TetR/AcrR family transcriptional regulator [Agromyces sp. MMS24-JH15]|uniref:TetR/AcrR family transcriptional regulator n=1 Tax=Agromyces sp. MMS24-JH15 TaxID=3243765 RepID=UPI0037493564
MAYHHGNLRQALVDEAVAAIAEHGADALSLRDLARRAGVSHAAPAHHFGDRAGLFTAIAADGFARLADALERAVRAAAEHGPADGNGEERGEEHGAARGAGASAAVFAEAGVAYVRFATGEPGRFAVMFRPDLVHDDDPALVEQRERAAAVLRAGAEAEPGDDRANALAAWSLVHGFATLWNAGAIVPPEGAGAEEVARAVAGRLFGEDGRIGRAR